MRSHLTIGLLLILLGLIFAPRSIYAVITINSISPEIIASPEEIITISASASGLSDSKQYLQAAITQNDQTNYFGYTKNNSNQWNKYTSSPASFDSFYSFTPINGKWTGQIETKVDALDSGYSGSGTYTLKLLKYISSPSHLDSNSVAIAINLVTQSPFPTNPDTTPNKPLIYFSPPAGLPVGTTLSIPVQTSNLPFATYYLKIRIGPDSSHLSSGQTFNGSWLNDNDSWNKFLTITPNAGNWQGSINARLPSGEKVGNYKIVLRLRKTDDNSNIDSDVKEINFTPEPNPSQSPIPVTTKTNQSTISKDQKSPTKTATKPDPDINSVLGASIQSSVTSNLSAKPNTAHKKSQPAINLKLADKKAQLDLKIMLILLGILLVLASALYFWSIRRPFLKNI